MMVFSRVRICRFCSGPDYAAAALRSIRENDYYRSFLAVGYRGGRGGVRRFLNRVALGMLKRGHFRTLIFFCARIYRAG